MKNRHFIALGLFAFPLHALSVILFAALEPSYSHLNKSVSTLGAYSASHTWLMNVAGLFMPGIIIAISFFAATQNKNIFPMPSHARYPKLFQSTYLRSRLLRLALWSGVLFGLCFAGLAMPMDADPMPKLGITLHSFLADATTVPFLFTSTITAFLAGVITEQYQPIANKHHYIFSPKFIDATFIKWALRLTPLAFVGIQLSHTLHVPPGLLQRGLLGCIFIWQLLITLVFISRYHNPDKKMGYTL